jgi:hypothetical protein
MIRPDLKTYLSINRCPVHSDFWSISIDDEICGQRITPSKCCGRWRTVKQWRLDARMITSMMEKLTNAQTRPESD